MKQKEDSPMSTVTDVVLELRQLAGLCGIMMCVGDSHTVIEPDEVAQVMTHLWSELDAQIKVLDGIQWKPEKDRVVA